MPTPAPNYDVENPVTALDQIAVDQLTPPLTDRTLLDAGCGTGRRLPSPSDTGLRLAVGVDLVREMLLANRDSAALRRAVLTGDVRAPTDPLQATFLPCTTPRPRIGAWCSQNGWQRVGGSANTIITRA